MAERRKEELDTGKFSVLLTAIRRQVYRAEDARRCLHYFQTNRERMRYPENSARQNPYRWTPQSSRHCLDFRVNIRKHGFSDFPCHGRTTSACLL